jgi:hypothetical protein
MAEIISLSKARKKKKREETNKKANENRVKFGRSKADKKLEDARKERCKKDLDGHKIDD